MDSEATLQGRPSPTYPSAGTGRDGPCHCSVADVDGAGCNTLTHHVFTDPAGVDNEVQVIPRNRHRFEEYRIHCHPFRAAIEHHRAFDSRHCCAFSHFDSDLGGYDKFKADFSQAGATQFGSGWAWVAVKNSKLEIMKTPNGENPLVHGASPILGVDVWEHSYYIDYRNARPKYLEAFVDSLINWDYVLEMYEAAA